MELLPGVISAWCQVCLCQWPTNQVSANNREERLAITHFKGQQAEI